MARDRLVINYDRTVNGVPTPSEITIKRPTRSHTDNARTKDSRLIADILFKDDPTNQFFDGAPTKRGAVLVKRVGKDKTEDLRGWHTKAEEEYRKLYKDAQEAKNKVSGRKRNKLRRKALREVKTLLHSPSLTPIPFTRTWKDRRDVRKALDTKGSALTIGRAQEKHSFKKRSKLEPKKGFLFGRLELGKYRAKVFAGMPFFMLGSDKKIAKHIIKKLNNGNETGREYSRIMARLENSILDPFNEIHGVGDALATMMKELQHGLVSSVVTNQFEKRAGFLKDFQEIPILLEKLTSPDPKSAFLKLVSYSMFYNWATGQHDSESVIGRMLMKAEEALKIHQANNTNEEAKTVPQKEKKRKMHHRVLKRFLPKPSILEEQMDRKVDRQDMVAMALTYMVLNDRSTRANKAGSDNIVYDEFKKSMAAGFVEAMNEHPSSAHIFLRRGMRSADNLITRVESEVENIIPGLGKEVMGMLLGKPQEIKDAATASSYELDGQKLLKIYMDGGSKKEFIDATAEMADKYVTNASITPLQREIWKQAKGYAAVVSDTYAKADNLLAA